MVIVFQGETGGTASFSIDSSIPAVSGSINVVGKSRAVYVYPGIIVSGHLLIDKEDVSNLAPGHYTLIPEVVDIVLSRYFLEIEDLQIIEVPE